MSGKGLAFLNKKGWHVGTIRNQEKVWKREQETAAEEKKLEEIKKQIEEERKFQELQQMKDAALPQHKKVEKLTWMYQGMAAYQQVSTEEHLLGKPIDDKAEKEDTSTLGLWRNRQITPQQDAWAKLRDDPLLEIKKRAAEAIEQKKKNPILMDKLKSKLLEEAKKAKELKESKKKVKDEDNVKRERRSRSRSRSPHRRDRRGRSRSPLKRERQRSRSRSPVRSRRSPPRSRSPTTTHRHRRSRSPPRRERERRESDSKPKISEEERQKRIQEMMQDAQTRENERFKKIKQEKEEENIEEQQLPDPEKLNFLHSVNKSVYDNDKTTLDERLNRNKHFRQNSHMLEETAAK